MARKSIVAVAAAAAVVVSGFLLVGCGGGTHPFISSPQPFTNQTQVWLAPNIGSDELDLFSHLESWTATRSVVNVFKFYNAQLTNGQCATCGPNVYSNLANVNAFALLKSGGIKTATEAGAVKEWGCTADKTIPVVQEAIDNVKAAGGRIDFVAMDEPITGGTVTINGLSCRMTQPQIEAQVVRFVNGLTAANPQIRIGDIEAYPSNSEKRLEGWLDDLMGLGYVPAFFHLDVDWGSMRDHQGQLSADLNAMRGFCASRGIPFGVIYMSSVGVTDDQSYYESAYGYFQTVTSAIGAPPHAVFQSWVVPTYIPDNLPEDGPYTLTHLVDVAVADLKNLKN